MKALWKAESFVVAVEKAVVTVALAMVLLTAAAQMAVRQLGGRSIGTDELAAVAMVTLVFIGGSLAVATHDHINIDLVGFFGSGRLAKAIRAAALVVVAVFAVVFTIYAIRYFGYAADSGESSLLLGIPLTLGTGIMVTGGMLMFAHGVLAVVRVVTGNEPTSPTDAAEQAEQASGEGVRK